MVGLTHNSLLFTSAIVKTFFTAPADCLPRDVAPFCPALSTLLKLYRLDADEMHEEDAPEAVDVEEMEMMLKSRIKSIFVEFSPHKTSFAHLPDLDVPGRLATGLAAIAAGF